MKTQVKTKKTGPGRGPGTLETRIKNLRHRLTKEQIEHAEKLSKEHDFEVIQLAWYIVSHKKTSETLRRRLKQHKRAMARLAERIPVKSR